MRTLPHGVGGSAARPAEARQTAGAARIGIDVLDRRELRRLIARPWFRRFCYAPEETARANAMGEERRLEYLAGRFAAKEAVLKALGTGMLRGIAPHEIYVDRDGDGAPLVRLRGRAADLGPLRVALSITHKENVVAAVAIVPPAPMGTDAAGPAAPRTDREESPAMSAAEPDSADETTAFLRIRIGQEDAHYGGGLVDGARVLRLFGDLVTEITVRTDGDEGLLSEYSGIRFTAPVRPGDYIEASGRLVRRTRLRRVVELTAHKVIAARPGAGDSAAEVLAEPRLVCSATATTVVPAARAAPAGGTAAAPAEATAPPPTTDASASAAARAGASVPGAPPPSATPPAAASTKEP
ncbi:holo-ACP synthase [Streptomyces sp. NPDC020141]|uniref:holo-ACP synthase n=1 Tax=Streptomyces sp. NPDC020141 TaxID=3365065 RepID=UPI00379EE45F